MTEVRGVREWQIVLSYKCKGNFFKIPWLLPRSLLGGEGGLALRINSAFAVTYGFLNNLPHP
jgi:hypothetical protein